MLTELTNGQLIGLIIVMMWTLPWKGLSLWRAVKKGDTTWFVILLVVNSLAILDILYLYIFSKRSSSDKVSK